MRPPYAFDPYYEPAHLYGTELANRSMEEWELTRPVSPGRNGNWFQIPDRMALASYVIQSGVVIRPSEILRLIDSL